MIEVPDGCDIDFPLPPGTKVGKLEHPLLPGTTKTDCVSRGEEMLL